MAMDLSRRQFFLSAAASSLALIFTFSSASAIDTTKPIISFKDAHVLLDKLLDDTIIASQKEFDITYSPSEIKEIKDRMWDTTQLALQQSYRSSEADPPPIIPAALLMSLLPTDSLTMRDLYQQTVYDPNEKKLGHVEDVLMNPEGQISAIILGLGGSFSAKKNVAVSFGAVKQVTKDNKPVLVFTADRDSLKSAPGFKYDSARSAWVPEVLLRRH